MCAAAYFARIFNILSPGLGPYSNFEIVIIIFELEIIG